jgi:hypothetical protein
MALPPLFLYLLSLGAFSSPTKNVRNKNENLKKNKPMAA